MRRSPSVVASLAPVTKTGQVVRRYRGLRFHAIQPQVCSTPYSLMPRLERQDIFTALVTPANVKPGWLMYNQAHQDGLDPPFPWRDRGKFPRQAMEPDARGQNTHTPPRGQAVFYFFPAKFFRAAMPSPPD
ncbi:hypothetical protein KL86DPRO_60087 [uncultured delta proteobacterium]|uniref:Uncharacterized protein n=1 Tax=uncultured delta proteobacterium TaxID=34034 RepID=A0A212KEU2_9DELT|nr:hypothetical protein KL86DPRO_60087 [uncultured delta proteobacterium]